ncbi:MAG TPA: alanine racemase [Thermoleophilaceae bacterium]|nr:alanine racemase [Thermoleophilaceae bacterium]
MSDAERALARIDEGAIERNCRALGALTAPGVQLCAVVKADGYGHGAATAAAAALRGGASWLAVATAAEAEDLRRHGIEARLLVMGALTRAELRTAVEADADVVAWTGELLEAAAALSGARVHVKLDTGMGRLGTKDTELARSLVGGDVAGVMTHFATADEPGDDLFPAQLERFGEFVEQVRGDRPDLVVHAANSAAAFRDQASHFDMVRCGVAIYGMDPFQGDPAERGLEPALSLESWVAAVRRFDAGESAGYGATWHAEATTWVATVPIGYGDGWRRGLSNDSDVLIRGRRYPVVGTVSMDNITVDVGTDPEVESGDTVTLIGSQAEERILVEEVAERLGTINYEVTCGLSSRVRRQPSR